MQLRSGKTTTSSCVSSCRRPTTKQVRDPSYKLSKVEQAKLVVREEVKERQRKAAEKYINNGVNIVVSVLSQMIAESELSPANVDPVMYKMRMVHMMYKYVNSVPRHVMTSSKLLKFRIAMLKKCKQFSMDGEKEINLRIKLALADPQLVNTRGEKGIRQYYTLHFTYMQEELTKFEEAYGNYL